MTTGLATPARILIVDDVEEMRLLLRYILEGNGYVFCEADSGKSAAAILDTGRFDLVVSDIRMPDGDGFSLLAEIRSRWPELPVILVSGYIDKASAARHGVSIERNFVAKVECPTRLLLVVKSALLNDVSESASPA